VAVYHSTGFKATAQICFIKGLDKNLEIAEELAVFCSVEVVQPGKKRKQIFD
jgi:hypothetical protein